MACKQYYVYKHTVPNGKVYIGITKQNPSKRWLNGLGYKHSTYFFNAIVKYGWLNIEMDKNQFLGKRNFTDFVYG